MNNSAAWNVVITKQKVDNSQQNERSTTKQQHSPSATCVFTNSYMKMGVTLKEISEQVVICMCQLFEIYFFAIATSFTRLQVNSRACARVCVCTRVCARVCACACSVQMNTSSLHCFIIYSCVSCYGIAHSIVTRTLVASTSYQWIEPRRRPHSFKRTW